MACDIMFLAKLCLLVMTLIHMTSCQKPQLYPFGRRAGDKRLTGDDKSSPAIQIEPPIKYFTKKYSTLFVNTNGVLSFGKNAISRHLTKTNFPKPKGTPPTIAPFWNDIDYDPKVWYRVTTDTKLLKQASEDIDVNWITASWLFIATWHRVQFHGGIGRGRERENTFQVILATDATRERSYAIFIYNDLEWDSSYTNGGWPENGLGGISPAAAGFDAGNGSDFVALEGSFTTDVKELDSKSNIGKRGYWVFNIKNRPEKDLCYKNQPCERGQCYTNGIDKVERCNCDGTGFAGTFCDNDRCQEINNPCKRGKCYTDQTTSEVYCDCQGTGHAGPTCDRKPCAKNPCNTGTCYTYLDGFDQLERCNCKGTGFHGEHCEIDLCAKHGDQEGPCIRGTCSKDNNGDVKCNCPHRYVGRTCDVDMCEDNGPCSSHGECYWDVGVGCRCQEGYGGEFCDKVKCVLCPTTYDKHLVCGSDGKTAYHPCLIKSKNCRSGRDGKKMTWTEGACEDQRTEFAAARGDGKLQPPVMLLLAALGLFHVIQYI